MVHLYFFFFFFYQMGLTMQADWLALTYLDTPAVKSDVSTEGDEIFFCVFSCHCEHLYEEHP